MIFNVAFKSELQFFVDFLIAGLEDQKQVLEADVLQSSYSEEATFEVGGRPDGWEAIQETTRARRKGDKSAPPLTDTGGLRALVGSVAPAETIGMRSETTLITPLGAVHTVFGPDVMAHQFGYQPHNLPARPFMVLQEGDISTIILNHEEYIQKLLT